jgi:hypothetical protein
MSHDLSQIGTASTNYFVNKLFTVRWLPPPLLSLASHAILFPPSLQSTSEIESSSTPASSTKGGRQGNNSSSKRTLGNQFKNQLNSLLDTINKTQPHFVRCLKSNMDKVPQNFDSQVIVHQLRYSGLLEICKIRQNGFPHRYVFEKFYRQFRILSPETSSAQELIETLQQQQQQLIASSDYCFGHTKIFLKDQANYSLVASWNQLAGLRAITIQKLIRKYLAKKRVFHLKNTLINLKKGIKKRDYELLVESLAVYHHFEYHTAVNRPLISDAKSLVTRLKSEKEVMEMLSNGHQLNDIRILESGIQKAKSLIPPFQSPFLQECMEKVVELTEAIESLTRPCVPEVSSPPLEARDIPQCRSNISESPQTDEENQSEISIPPRLQRKTLFWPPSPDVFDLPHLSNNHRHSIALTGSHLNSRMIRPPPIEISDDEPRGRQFIRKQSVIRSETRSFSPPTSPRISIEVPQRSFSPPPTLHSSSKSPQPLPKMGIRTSMLTRQVSTADMNDMESIHEIISDLVRACSSEDGITVDDIDPIEQALQQVQYSGSALAKYASELMMAREELARAKKQLELQASLTALTERTPLWKIRNLVQQAEKLGMENYRGESVNPFSSSPPPPPH